MNNADLSILLRSSGLSVRDLAERARVSEERLRSWEQGRRKMSPTEQGRLFVALHEAYEARRAESVTGVCDWQRQFIARVVGEVSAGRVPDEAGYDDHVRSCAVCSKQDAWERANPFPLVLPAEPLWSRVLGPLLEVAVTDNPVVPVLVGAGSIATSLVVRFVMPQSIYWDILLYPIALYAAGVLGVQCYRVVASGLGRSGFGGWSARFVGWVVGVALALGLPITGGSRSLLEGEYGEPVSFAVMLVSGLMVALLFSIAIHD